FLLPACSASAKLIWLIALAPLQGSALHARNVLLIRPSLEDHSFVSGFVHRAGHLGADEVRKQAV
ncbi:hypothetical protein ACSFBI_32285, partial [Variovorax sp. RB3P1]|uniref:hypothetical protein n=1 Tax=Variovorax sp. RB3P1 TaxID=3443732 RepID=UPI003F46B598